MLPAHYVYLTSIYLFIIYLLIHLFLFIISYYFLHMFRYTIFILLYLKGLAASAAAPVIFRKLSETNRSFLIVFKGFGSQGYRH